ncbi:MAG: NAD-dependent epimerase/dehydratase family protein [Proteobacteria bacterium]|nr:NAD-dependent epimerase/dehydratase family protein [Pseudomonadota bacterium]
MRVLIAGAGGYLGGHLVKAALDAGHDVTGFVHTSATKLPPPAKTTIGDLNETSALQAALTGIDAAIFSAGRNWQPGLAISEYSRQNVSITESFFRALQTVNPHARVVFTSSMSAIAGSEDPIAFDEETGRNAVAEPRLNAYDRSKIECERLARTARERGSNVVILNPGLMLGPAANPQTKVTTTFLVHWHCLKKNPAIVAQGGHSFCDVRDVARAHVVALTRGGGQYLLGGENLSNLDFQRALSDQTGLGIPHQIPPIVPVLASAAMDAASLATLGFWKNPIHREFARSLPLYYWANSSRAARELDYKSRPLATTLRDTIADSIDNKAVPERFRYVADIDDENRLAMLLMHELANRHLHRSHLMPKLSKILAACRQNGTLNRALESALAAGTYDTDTGQFRWTAGRPAASLTTLNNLLDYCYYASDDFHARMMT